MKTVTLITHFPEGSPRAGKETFFREMFFNSLLLQGKINEAMYNRYREQFNLDKRLMPPMPEKGDKRPDVTSPAIEFYKDHVMMMPAAEINKGEQVVVLFGRPDDSYKDLSVLFDGLTIESVQSFRVIRDSKKFGIYCDDVTMQPHQVEMIAWNEGMSRAEFDHSIGYPKPFSGKIISWNAETVYGKDGHAH